ncbi:MAG TPA: AraC family transcriptional regulator [Steroidobacteraceae bacterium]|nr:AraC family transcriptional regulator [Steroidobacteraceae bacterium]
MNNSSQVAVRRVEPLAHDWRSVRWDGGCFDTARRPLTEVVEGTIRLPQYLILATLHGGARTLRVRAECGHRFQGPERAGAISLVIPDCERRLQLTDVQARWASLAIDADVFDGEIGEGCASNIVDPFLFALLSEMQQLQAVDDSLDASYCEAMSLAAVRHLQHRHFSNARAAHSRASALPRWQLRRIEDYIESHLDRAIRIADLAGLCGYSAGHFHRAFRRTCGMTPLEFVNQRRVHRAVGILQAEPGLPVVQLAERVGYTSPSYFARLFRRLVGVGPARYGESG